MCTDCISVYHRVEMEGVCLGQQSMADGGIWGFCRRADLLDEVAPELGAERVGQAM